MFIANCRHGEYDKMKQQALEAISLFSELDDKENEAFTKSALDLADTLPDVWKPGQAGGYVMAVFPLEAGDDGYKFLDPKSVRNYTWGCPSRCAALVHLLRPRRFLGSSLKVGSTWEDEFGQIHDGISWGIGGDDKVIAKSVVESDNDTVVTPAGNFEKCIRVNTTITPIDDVISPEFRTRSYCGTKMMWFAPGVGLVKLRYEDQNRDTVTVYLIEYSKADGNGYFPLSKEQTWHYKWIHCEFPNEQPASMFEDICRVIDTVENISYISSATWGLEKSKGEALEYMKKALEYDKNSADFVGEAITHTKIAQLSDGKSKHEYYEKAIKIYESLERELDLFNARYELKESKSEIDTDESIRLLEEKRKITHKIGNWREEAWTLVSIRDLYFDSKKDVDKAIEILDQSVKIFSEHGDIDNASLFLSYVELYTEQKQYPKSSQCRYTNGGGNITRKDNSLYSTGSSRITADDDYPSKGYKGSPMVDLFYIGPYDGIELLLGDVGRSVTGGSNTGSPWGVESTGGKSTLISKNEKIAVSAGEFTKCALIETEISTSDEADNEEKNFYRGYWGGIRQAWFAPGVGLVRSVYQHKNGYKTEIELVSYEITEPSKDYFPLALNNRWRYRWVDQKSGVNFEDSLRVASHKNGKWNIAFVTRATTQA
jgi:hypothetical protein